MPKKKKGPSKNKSDGKKGPSKNKSDGKKQLTMKKKDGRNKRTENPKPRKRKKTHNKNNTKQLITKILMEVENISDLLRGITSEDIDDSSETFSSDNKSSTKTFYEENRKDMDEDIDTDIDDSSLVNKYPNPKLPEVKTPEEDMVVEPLKIESPAMKPEMKPAIDVPVRPELNSPLPKPMPLIPENLNEKKEDLKEDQVEEDNIIPEGVDPIPEGADPVDLDGNDIVDEEVEKALIKAGMPREEINEYNENPKEIDSDEIMLKD